MLRLRWSGSISLACVVLVASSCGGGDPPEPDPVVPTSPVLVSGTVAAGAPLVGTVTVKDSSSPARITAQAIGANGSYTIDVRDMVAPLVFRAEGNAGGAYYLIHSATTGVGSGGTLNITPLTDLVVANAAGQLADAYFDAGNFSGLTQAMLDTEAAALRNKLLPVLQAMNVPAAASIDLLRTPFTPLAPGLDAALDVIHVSIDPATRTATITNIAAATPVSIVDDLTKPAATEPAATLASDARTGQVADDLPKIRKALTDFIDLYKTALPQPAAILPLLSDGFLHGDKNRNVFAGTRADDFAAVGDDASPLIGGSITDIAVALARLDYEYNGGANPLAYVSFIVRDKDGIVLSRVRGFTIIRGNDGVWRLNGDQNVLSTEAQVLLANDLASGCRYSGIQFDIQDDEDTGNSADIAYLLVTGPGLPHVSGLPEGIGQLRINRATDEDEWDIQGGQMGGLYVMASTGTGCVSNPGIPDAAIAAIPDNAVYVFRAFNSANVPMPLGAYGLDKYGYVGVITPRRPLTQAELGTSTQLPTFTASPAVAAYSGGNITINVANANPARWAAISLEVEVDGDPYEADAAVVPAANGTFSRTLGLSLPAGAINGRRLLVVSTDDYDRIFLTLANYQD